MEKKEFLFLCPHQHHAITSGVNRINAHNFADKRILIKWTIEHQQNIRNANNKMPFSKPSYAGLAVFALLAGVASVPGADCFVPQKLAAARGEFANT